MVLSPEPNIIPTYTGGGYKYDRHVPWLQEVKRGTNTYKAVYNPD
jgi:hypothetical protein